jgi:RNA polymerase sigma factor (sigma-70 family)
MTSILAHRQPGDCSFERLYRAHVQDVYRYSLMLLRNRADAEDVAQTTFMKAYRAIQRGDRPRHPRKWLITIAHNTCRTHARDGSRRPQEVAFDDELTEPTAPPSEPEVDVSELVKALGALSFNQRSALVMRELEGRSYAEIAAALEISCSAVETLLFRARRVLREQLEGALTCGEAEHALSLQLDGRLDSAGRADLRAHLRECAECASLARRLRARRAALRSLGPLPLPASIASWGGGAAAGSGVAVKVAAILAAGIVAAGASHEYAQAVDVDAAAPAAPAPSTSAPPPQARVAATTARERPAVAPRPVRRTPLRGDQSASGPAATLPAEPAPAAAPSPAPAQSPSPTAERPAPIVEAETPQVEVEVAEIEVTVPAVTVSVPAPPPVPIEVPPLPIEVPTLP